MAPEGLKPRRRFSSRDRSNESDDHGVWAAQEEVWNRVSSSMSPSEVDRAWKQLLEDTLPPDKQAALMETYAKETDPRMKYNMLLEFSSYLRQALCSKPNANHAIARIT